jgi:hypothetical protein
MLLIGYSSQSLAGQKLEIATLRHIKRPDIRKGGPIFLRSDLLFGFVRGQSPLLLVALVLARQVNCTSLRDALIVTAPDDVGALREAEDALDGFTAMVS